MIQERGMNHSAALDSRTFVSKFKSTSTRSFAPKSIFKSSAHKLPAEFGRIMSKKMWSTLSQDTLDHSSAALGLADCISSGWSERIGDSYSGSFTKNALLTCL